jgi:hypothetical protein
MFGLNWWNVGPPRAWSHHQLPNVVQNVLLHQNTTAENPSPFRMTSWARWMVYKPPKAIVQVSEGRARPSRVCQSASKATNFLLQCANQSPLSCPRLGASTSIHGLQALMKVRTGHFLMNICLPGKVLQRQQVRPPGVHKSQGS